MSNIYGKTNYSTKIEQHALVQTVIMVLVGLIVSGLVTSCASSTGQQPAKESAKPASASPTFTSLPTRQSPKSTVVPTFTPPPSPATSSPTPKPATAPTDTPTAAPANKVSFTNDVLPILQARCERCHGGQRSAAGFSTASYDAVMAGSANGQVVNPGDPAGSYLLDVIISRQMPRGGQKLSPAEIDKIKAWIVAGAPNN